MLHSVLGDGVAVAPNAYHQQQHQQLHQQQPHQGQQGQQQLPQSMLQQQQPLQHQSIQQQAVQHQHQPQHQQTQSSPALQKPPTPLAAASRHGGNPKIRRRNRLITSCLECRRRKLKCDKLHPCSNCTKFVRDCVFLAPALDPASQLKLAEIKEKMGTLERTLEDDVARRKARSKAADAAQLSGGSDSSDEEEEEADPPGEQELEPTMLAVQDATYFEDADDDLMDLGIKIGKMRITDRLGGFVRPKLAYEV